MPKFTLKNFSVGDRVIALAGTEWDTDGYVYANDSEREYFMFEGNYGHVVEHCEECDGLELIHVHFEGSTKSKERTSWTDTVWHMYPEEIEHAD